jgi:glycosyltransferase involved in cell wall biosynthesis
MHPTLSAVVPATNRPSSLSRCVEAIRAANDPPEELVIVDECDVPGPAAARNDGARRAGGDVLVFVDADVLPHPDAFHRIRSTFESSPELVAVFGSYDDIPEADGTVSAFRNLLHHHVHQQSAGRASTFWAGLGAVRRTVFFEAGGFDSERYRTASIEDIELGARLAPFGEIRLDPHLLGTHLKHWTLRNMIATDFSRRGVPWATLLLRGQSDMRTLNLGWRHRVSALACLAFAAAVPARRVGAAFWSAAVFVALNRSFYSLLLRRRGLGLASAGVPLHALHHAVGIAAAATALATQTGKRLLRREPPAR